MILVVPVQRLQETQNEEDEDDDIEVEIVEVEESEESVMMQDSCLQVGNVIYKLYKNMKYEEFQH
jgi:hypothetical protein